MGAGAGGEGSGLMPTISMKKLKNGKVESITMGRKGKK